MVPVATNQILLLTPMLHFRTPPNIGYVIICHHMSSYVIIPKIVKIVWLCHHIGYVIILDM